MTHPRYKALIFDMDGTLTRPALDFRLIRQEIGRDIEGDLAHGIEALPPAEQARAWAIIEAHEERAMREQELQSGAEGLVRECRRRNVKVGVVTRNLRRSVDHLCARYGIEFDAVLTREFPHLKPDPAPVLHMLRQWGLAPADTLVVGDYLHDIDCGRAAGADTCFFQNPGQPFFGENADYLVNSMAELRPIVLGDNRKGDNE